MANQGNGGVTLRKLSMIDGEKERQFLLRQTPMENGLEWPTYKHDLSTPKGFREYLQEKVDAEEGIGLAEGRVPGTVFWVLVNGELAGYASVRHYLNDALREHGGHIGLGIAPEFRGHGVGRAALKQLVDYTKSLGEEKVLVTVQESNSASRKMVEACGAELKRVANGLTYYWF